MPPILCQVCKKNVATVQLTKITEKKRRELHLCEECAKKKGLLAKPVPGSGEPRVICTRVWPRKKPDKE